jgi:O-antigen/teichoic acid export membrane protein
MTYRTYKNSLFYVVSYIVSRFQTFLVLPFLARLLSPAQLGALEGLSTFSFFITMLVVFNLDTSYSTYFHEMKSREEKSELFWTAFVDSVLLASMACLIVFLSKNLILEVIGLRQESGVAFALAIAFVGTVLGAWNHLFQVLFRMRFESHKYAFLLILNTSLNLGVTLILLTKNPTIISVLLGTLLANALTFITSLVLARGLYPIRFSFTNWLPAFARISLPLLPFSFFVWTLTYVDRSLLAHFRGLEEVGFYGVVSRLSSISGVVLGPFQIAWLPFAMRTWGEDQSAQKFPIAFKWICLFCSILILLIGGFSTLVIGLVAGEKYSSMSPYMPILALCNVLNILAYFPLVSFMHVKKTYTTSIAFFIGASSNFFLNLIFIPAYGIKSAVYVNLLSYLAMWITAISFEKRHTRLPYAYVRAAVLLGLGLVGGIYVNRLATENGIGVALSATFAGGALLCVCYYLLGLFKESDVTNFLRKAIP